MIRTIARPRVVITHWVHPEVIELLAAHCEVIPNPTRETWPRERVLQVARDADAAIMFMPDRVDDPFLAECPRLKVIAAALKGYDNFDVAACTRRGVWLACVPDLLTVPTAELAIGLLLAITRRMPEGDDHIRSGGFQGWRPELYGQGLTGKTIGFIGLGAVGRAIAERLAAWRVRMIYADPIAAPPATERHCGLVRVSIDELLATSDFVLPLLHLKRDTHHLLDARALARVKQRAYVINVGRGSLVDEAAIAESLASGHLAGYAADVFEMEDWALETRPRAIHPALLAHRARTLLTPHIGSAVDSVRRDIALEAAENVLDVLLRGVRPRGAVNAVSGKGSWPRRHCE
jgi:phosphonate dehydrogenase